MNKIKFLSVSALNMYLNQPNKFYMMRLADEKLPRDPQSLAAAAGTMFDINVKQYLILKEKLNKYNKTISAVITIKNRLVNFPWYQKEKESLTLEELLMESLEPQNRVDEIFDIGKRLFNAYINSELFKKTQFHDVENRNIFELKVKLRGIEHKVPIYSILDCVLSYNNFTADTNILYPMDLKVSGYSSGASPKKGYCNSYDESGNSLGAHKDYIEGIAFDTIDEQWAMQGCTYGWSIGRELFKPFPFSIHALFIGIPKQDGSRSIKICEYNGIITEEFQKLIALKYIQAWNTINSNINSSADTDIPWCDEPLLCEMMSRTEHFGW